MSNLRKSFYESKEYIEKVANNTEKSGNDRWISFYQYIISAYHKSNRRLLEIGCGKAAISNLIDSYVGVDISFLAIEDNDGDFINAEATELPIKADSFHTIISHRVLEHIPDPEKALLEYRRVLHNKGILVLNDAWFCRQYICWGLLKKKYSELAMSHRIHKFFIPVIEFKAIRLPCLIIRRVIREITAVLTKGKLKYKTLDPSYDVFYGSDSDACSSIDPHSVILFFKNMGADSLSHPGLWHRLFARNYIVIKIFK